jgi:transposase
MLKLPSLGEMDGRAAVRVFLYTSATDMRRSFDTLGAIVVERMGKDPFSGDLFVFVGRGRDRLKVLYWDTDGFGLWYKRLEEGTFRLPKARGDPEVVELRPSELAMLLEGIDLRSIKRLKRYARPVK